MKQSLIDITPKMGVRTPVYPGDPPFVVRLTASVAAGDPADVSAVSFSAHCGAHVEAPAHLFPGTGDAASLPLERFVGPCLVIDLTELEPEAAPSELVRPQTIAAVKALMGGKALPSRVLIKTRRYGAVIFERCRPNVLKHFWPKVWSLWGLTCRALILQTVRSSLRTALHSAAV